MPSARDLLRQADALMRRNRRRGKSRDGSGNTLSGDAATLTGEAATSTGRFDVPTLTDALALDAAAPFVPTVVLPDATADADPIFLDTLADLPVLTDAVEIVTPGVAADAAASPVVPEATANPVVTASSPPVAFVDEEFILEIPPVEAVDPAATLAEGIESPEVAEGGAIPELVIDGIDAPAAMDAKDAGPAFAPGDRGWGGGSDRDEDVQAGVVPAPTVAAAPTPAAGAGPESERAPPDWDALADEIRAQVMQRLDLFTDTGLREQLGARLQPIVARASAELVDTINRQVGELVRSYVAEAIEREIDSWRSHHP